MELTNGQEFYLIFCLLYLCQCVQLVEPHGIAIRSNIFKGWSTFRPFVYFAGLQKSILLLPLLPFCSPTFISQNLHTSPPKQWVTDPKRALSLLNLSSRVGSSVQFFSSQLFFLFLIALPFTYYLYGPNLNTLIIASFTGLAILLNSVCFFIAYGRLHKHSGGSRAKYTLYTLVFPWCAIRSTDMLYHGSILTKVHPLTFCAVSANAKSLAHLDQEFRNALYKKRSTFEQSHIESILQQSDRPIESVLNPTEQNEAPFYCPCCHISYSANDLGCSDCNIKDLMPRANS